MAQKVLNGGSGKLHAVSLTYGGDAGSAFDDGPRRRPVVVRVVAGSLSASGIARRQDAPDCSPRP
ncbi:hypothetical protein [Streptomyces sp. NBRC 110028]|uniref:hypothetical protein n=1 Tax=Streptomyces sp. NBRC 110028 TaxID=1621260 RepID=UPI0006E3E274|nr:hypothetical protein [Streptomyces sp. NBRC 110028]